MTIFTAPKQREISYLKGTLSDLTPFLAAENPLKMMKNVFFFFFFTSKTFFVLKIFKFLSWVFGHIAKRIEKKEKKDLI